MNLLEMISCHNFVVIGGYAYFSNCFFNGFFKVKIQTGKTYFLGYFKNEKISEKNIHKEIFEKDSKIYFCPRKGRHVHIYNLVDESLLSIEIRKNLEQKYLIREVVCGDKFLYFLPDQKGYSIKMLELKTAKVFERDENFEPQGEYLSECKDIFPDCNLIEKYYKKFPSNFFGRRILSENWYVFSPIGGKLLKYKMGGDHFEEIKLEVINNIELEEYIHNVQTELLKEKIVSEKSLELPAFIKCVKNIKKDKGTDICGNKIGNIVWNNMKF
ncbi:hypothetical protein IMSAGC020_01642 [Lachnospiraceae bacterium]|nr:hypothetical protein IMSAGC020_01642 [Lachnospiraceae bacterium]